MRVRVVVSTGGSQPREAVRGDAVQGLFGHHWLHIVQLVRELPRTYVLLTLLVKMCGQLETQDAAAASFLGSWTSGECAQLGKLLWRCERATYILVSIYWWLQLDAVVKEERMRNLHKANRML